MHSQFYLLQWEGKILTTYVISKEQGKILKVFVCDSIICQLDLEHKVHSMKNVHTTKVKVSWNCRKVCKTIRFISKPRVTHNNKLIEYIIFTHCNININVYVSLSLKKCNLHIKPVYGLWIRENSVMLETQQNVFFSLSRGIFDIQNISFKFPNNLLCASFCINVVFPQLVCPPIKMLPLHFPS